MKRLLYVVGVLMVLGVGWVGSAMAGVTVYNASGSSVGNYSTIQEGINACPAGGKVSVSAGTYMESIYIDRQIALVGVGMPVIDASGLGTNTSTATVTFNGLETAEASISGFKITGNKGGNGINCKICANPRITDNVIMGNKGSGINCVSSFPVISNNTITGNNYGILCSSSSPDISNNKITGNSNYGIFCSSSYPVINNNKITGNSSSGIYCSNSSPTISNNTIAENGNGIYCVSSSFPAISNNTITGNSSSGISCSSSAPTISNNNIIGNKDSGISCSSSSPVISNNTITGNSDYGISCSSSSSPTISNNTITGNSSSGIYCYYSSPTISNNNIIGNKDSGIYCSSSSPTITNNTIKWHTYGIKFPYNSKIYNNIIVENGLYGIYGECYCKIDYNCVWSSVGGNYSNYSSSPGTNTNNISLDPQFISRSDCRLQSSSPCIDRGLNTASGTTTRDMDGNPRIAGGTIDIGAYEFQGASTRPVIGTVLSITETVDKAYASPGDTLTYTLTYKNISNIILNNVNITAKIPGYTAYIENSASYGGVNNYGQQITWNDSSLLPNTDGVATFKVKVNETTPNATIIKNNATIKCTEAMSAVISRDAITTINTVMMCAAPPRITYDNPIRFWGTANTVITIKANISGSAVNAVLHYRKKPAAVNVVSNPDEQYHEDDFIPVPMSKAGDTYTGVIPFDAVTIKGLEYYIEATDNASHVATTNRYSITVGYPVLLVHGLNSDAAGSWRKEKCNFVEKLVEQPVKVFTIDLKPANGDIKELSGQLSAKIDSIKKETNAPRIDLVGYSMGGLVSRWYTRFDDKKDSVRKLIMIGTPNHGCELLGLYYFSDINVKKVIVKQFGDPGQAGQQMLPCGPFLNQLNYGKWNTEFGIKDILSPKIKYYTIAGKLLDQNVALWGTLLKVKLKHDGAVSVNSVKLDDINNIEVTGDHTNLTNIDYVCNKVADILQDRLPQQSPPLISASAPDGTPTAVYHLPLIYGTISQSETKSHNIQVDSNITEISFLSGWNGGDIGLTLKAPDGTLITSTSSAESVTYFNEASINVAGYTIKKPGAGTWTVNINANNVSGVGTYSVEILAESTLILSLATDKNVYNPNQPFHITAMLANSGVLVTGASVTARIITPANAEDILLYDDGTHDDTQANDGTYTNTYANTNMSGNYCVGATAMGNIGNEQFVRQASTILWVEQFPDLTIAANSITFSNNTPSRNEQITISATINNIGDIAATNTVIFFYDGLPSESGSMFGSSTIGNISTGGNAVVLVPWKAIEGSHTIFVTISPYNSFLEKDYNNNSAAKQITVASPDLSVSSADISLNPIYPIPGEMATITVVIYNTGTVKADGVVAGFFVGNPLGTGTGIGTQTIATIPAKGSNTVSLAWNTTGYGGITPIYIQLDPQNKILEADEDNNIAAKDVYIQESDTTLPTIVINSPSSGQTVFGFVNITAIAEDNVGVIKVEFYIDEALKGTDITPPYSYQWDAAKENNDPHIIKAVAYDPSGLTGTKSIGVTVNNSLLDITSPAFSIAITPSPAGVGTVSIVVTASEQLAGSPDVIARDSSNGTISTVLVVNTNPVFKYQANITPATAQGTATITVSGNDLTGNPSSGTNSFQIEKIGTPPTPVMGTLSVTSTPSGANIIIDGAGTGKTTQAGLSLETGSYILTLTKTNCNTYTTMITISSGSVTCINAVLIPLVGTLNITSSPTGATILLDGVDKGITPLELPLDAGTCAMALSLANYYIFASTLTIDSGTTTNIAATLTPVSTLLKITPAIQTIAKGDEIIVGVEINAVRGMVTGKLHLSFNPDILEVKEIGTGTFMEGGNIVKQYDNATGTIDYFVGLVTGSATGSGVICSIKFKAKEGGTSSIVFDFDEPDRLTRLKDEVGNNIPFNKQEASYSVIAGVKGIKITPQDTIVGADENIAYQCIAMCDNNMEIDVTGSATFTAEGGGSFTQNSLLATSVVILPGIPSAIIYISGDNQRGSCASTLKEPFVVKVVDKYNNLCEGVVVNWEVVGLPSLSVTGYCISPTNTTTNSYGIASSSLTLGTEPPGTWTVQAILPGGDTHIFTAHSSRRFGNISGFCMLDLGEGRSGAASRIQVTIIQTGATTTTNGSSYFIFEAIPTGSYTLCFDTHGAASRKVAGVRISETQFENTTCIGTVSLLAGDVSNDGRLNLEDWPGFADAFFKQESGSDWEWNKRADFNHDGRVDDEDFIVFRNNYGRQVEGTIILQNSPLMASRAEATGGSLRLSFNLETLDGMDVKDLRVGNIIYLEIRIHDAKGLLGGEVHLSYDPRVLEVVNLPVPEAGHSGNARRLLAENGGIRIQSGDYFIDGWELMNKADNVSGKIDYAVGVFKPETKGEGILAVVPFRIKTAGVSSMSFDFKEEENRQTLFVERRYVEGKPVDTISDVQSEGIIINVPKVFIPDDIRVYPNPVDAGKGNEVIFGQLPAGKQVSLKVYNLAGELVFERSGMNEIRWGLRNEDNEPVASGIYVYSLRDESGTSRQGKIGVVR
ncbi:right-handed parallel beta-helix repeat-containing protein [Candidatus Desantisbacteria bacterium]|nr:right-handed parallel beta-helix repeat-containing protein [Candidatus Desantisbacteria bacterium]